MGSANNCQTEILVGISYYRLIIALTLCFTLQFMTVTSTKQLQSLRPKRQRADQQLLPSGWEQFCVPRRKHQLQVDVQCFVNRQFSGLWKFDELKHHLAKQNIKYTFTVKCEDAATISLYWPMKATNLRGISVENCRLDDYFSGLEKQSDIPDELEYYVFRNNIIVVDVKNLILISKNPIDQDYDCGNEDTINYYVDRNTTYEFEDSADYSKLIQSYYMRESKVPEVKNDVELIFSGLKLPRVERKQLKQASKDFHAKIASAEHKCMFTSLFYKEDSPSDNGFSPNVKNSNFPVLSIYNMSHSNLQTIPESFSKWFYHLQNLQLIDASHNNIKKFRFDSDVDVWDVPALTVNLSYNNITDIKAKQIVKLAETKKLFVDFRNNPLNCSCTDTTKQLIAFIKDKGKWSQPSYQRYSYIREMRCYYPDSLRGKQLLDLTNKDLGCEILVVEKMMVEGIACLGAVVGILVVIILFVVALVYCRRSRQRFVWNVDSLAGKSPANFSDPAEIYTVVIPGEKQQIPNIKIPSIL